MEILNGMRNFRFVSKKTYIDYIEDEIIKECANLERWKEKYNCINIEIRDNITNLNYIHCYLTETNENENFNVLLYDYVNIYGNIFNDEKFKWGEFIVFFDNGDIEIYKYGKFEKINLNNVETGKNENIIVINE